jgi:hypothetical protein
MKANVANRVEDASTDPQAVWTRPWRLAGWMVVTLLAIVLVVFLLGAIAILVSAYDRKRLIQESLESQATMANLTMTFDEDLPIVDIQIDGASCLPFEISPVERGCRPGSRTITVVYAHGERRRSVRHTVNIVAHQDRTLDLTPLVVGDMEERDRRKRQKQREMVPVPE